MINKILSVLIVLQFLGFAAVSQWNMSKIGKNAFYNIQLSFATSNSAGISTNGGLLSYGDIENTKTIDLKGFANYYFFNEYMSAGAGIMISRTFNPNFNQFWLMGELKVYFDNEVDAPFFYIQLGKSLPIADVFNNGQGGGLGLGWRIEILNHIFMIDVSLFNRSVQFDNLAFRNSEYKAFVTGAYFGIGYQF
jgi:hypothetical protein